MADDLGYSVSELAGLAGVSRQSIWELITKKKLVAHKAGHVYFIPKWAGDAYIQSKKGKKK